MSTVAFIGSGNIGGTVARLAVMAGYDVVLSISRAPQTLENFVRELGPHARAATPVEAAAAGELVVLSVPPKAYLAIPGQPLSGKPVLDASNYIAQRDGRIPGLHDGQPSSEFLQQRLEGARLVKVFNNITSWHLLTLARPSGAADRSALPIAGDDVAAKAAVTRFLDDIGYDAVDAGPLASGGRRFEFGTPAFVTPYGGLRGQGTPADVAAIRAVIGVHGS
jgi:predicted dinucleotide-binding enzyme